MAAKETNNGKKILVTKEGLKKLEEELQDLIDNKRQEIADRIAQAKEYGDLSENSEYEVAKEEQAFLEGRITQLQLMIKNAVVIDENSKHNRVEVGSKVRVKLKDGEEIFHIVGSAEANPGEGKISNESPIGQALMNRKVGETVKVKVPAGFQEIKIVSIK